MTDKISKIIPIEDLTDKRKQMVRMMVNNICGTMCPRNSGLTREEIKTIFLQRGFKVNAMTGDLNESLYLAVGDVINAIMDFKQKGK